MNKKYLDYDGLVVLVDAIKNGDIITGSTKATGIVWGDYKIPLNNLPQGALERLYNVTGIKDAVNHSVPDGAIQPGDTIRFNDNGTDILGDYANKQMFVCTRSNSIPGLQNIEDSGFGFMNAAGQYTATQITKQSSAISKPIYLNAGDTIKFMNNFGFDYVVATSVSEVIEEGSSLIIESTDPVKEYTASQNEYIVVLQSYNAETYRFGKYQIGNSISDNYYITLFKGSFVEFAAGTAQKAVESEITSDVRPGSLLDNKINNISKKSGIAFDQVTENIPTRQGMSITDDGFDVVYCIPMNKFYAVKEEVYYNQWSKYGFTDSDYNESGQSKNNALFTSSFGYVYNGTYYESQDKTESIPESEIRTLFD